MPDYDFNLLEGKPQEKDQDPTGFDFTGLGSQQEQPVQQPLAQAKPAATPLPDPEADDFMLQLNREYGPAAAAGRAFAGNTGQLKALIDSGFYTFGSPEKAAMALDTAKQAGQSPYAVHLNQEKWDQGLRVKKALFAAGALKEDDPVYQYLKRPGVAVTWFEDIPVLGSIEYTLRSFAASYGETRKTAQVGLLASRFLETGNPVYLHKAQALERSIPDTQAHGILDEWLVQPTGHLAGYWLPAFLESQDEAVAGSMAGGTVGSAMPGVGTAAGAAAGYTSGLTAGLWDFYRKSEAGHAFLEISKFKDVNGQPIDPEVARITSILAGYASGALELAQVERMFKFVKNTPLKRLAKLEGMSGQLARLFLDWGMNVTYEDATEVAQEATTILAGAVARGVAEDVQGTYFQPTDWGAAGQRLVDTATGAFKEFAGPLAMGLVPGAMRGDYRTTGEQAQRAQDQIVRQLSQAKAAQASPRVAEDALSYLARQHPAATEVYISPDVADKVFFQGAAPDLAEAVGITESEVLEAAELGMDVAIPIEKLAQLAPYWDKIGPSVKMHPEERVQGEAPALSAEEAVYLEDLLQEEEERTGLPEDVVVSLADQLVLAGAKKSQAESVALILAHRARTFAQTNTAGLSALDWFEQHLPVQFRRTAYDDFQGRPQAQVQDQAGPSQAETAVRDIAGRLGADPDWVWDQVSGLAQATDPQAVLDTVTRTLGPEGKLALESALGMTLDDVVAGAQTLFMPLNPGVDLERQVQPIDAGEAEGMDAHLGKMRKMAQQRARGHVGTYRNTDTGWDITLSNRSAKHLSGDSPGEANYAAMVQVLDVLPQVVQDAVLIETHEDMKGKQEDMQVHRLYAPVRVGDSVYVVKLTVKESKPGQAVIEEFRFYDLRSEKEMPAGTSANLPGDQSPSRPAAGINTFSVRQLLDGVNDADGNPFLDEKKALFQSPLGFYSVLAQAVQGIDSKAMPAQDWANRIKKLPGVKQEELDDLGLFDWLAGMDGKVGKAAVLEFIEQGGPKVEEVVKGSAGVQVTQGMIDEAEARGDWEEHDRLTLIYEDQQLGNNANDTGNETKFGQYQLPGGENYREVLLTLPTSDSIPGRYTIFVDGEEWASSVYEADLEGEMTIARQEGSAVAKPEQKEKRAGDVYRSSHWSEPNVLAHVRLNDRIDADGKRTLFIEEIQSDWHQEGRKKGYERQKPEDAFEFRPTANGQIDVYLDGGFEGRWESREKALADLADHPNFRSGGKLGVPDAPFKKSWAMLAFKRVLRMAVEEGYDAVAWTPGEVQADRYDLSKQVDYIEVERQPNGEFDIMGMKDGQSHDLGMHEADKLQDVLGKELAARIIERGDGRYEGADLKVGGEGMKGFYDNILPKEIGKYVKKLDKDAKVGTAEIDLGEGDAAVPGWHVLDGETGDSVAVFPTQGEAQQYLLDELYGNGSLAQDKGEQGGIQEAWSLHITDKMREEVLAGQTYYDANRGATQFLQNAEAIVHLFETAGFDTLIHEGGHLLLEDMGRMVASGIATEDVHRDWGTLFSWFSDHAEDVLQAMQGGLHDLKRRYNQATGDDRLALGRDMDRLAAAVDEVQARGGADYIRSLAQEQRLDATDATEETVLREFHELFADGFIDYLKNGKPPVGALWDVFRRVKQWLLEAYQAVRHRIVPITDEVAEVMARLLATENEIRQARQDARFVPLNDLEMDILGVSEQDRADYAQAAAKADRAAVEAVERRRLAEQRKLERQWAEEAKEWMMTDPFYQAVDDYRNAKSHLEDRGPGIDLRSVEAMIGKEGAQELRTKWNTPGKWALLRDDGKGTPVDLAAPEFGFESSDELVLALQEKSSEREYIKGHVDSASAAWDREYNASQEWFSQEREDLLEMESKMLGKEMPGRKPMRSAAIRRFVEEKVGISKAVSVGKDYKNLRSALQKQDMELRRALIQQRQRLVKESREQVRRAVVDANERRRVQVAMIRAQQRARVERDTILKRAKRIGKDRNVPYEWRQQILALLDRFWLGTLNMHPDGTPPSLMEFIRTQGIEEEALAVIPDWVFAEPQRPRPRNWQGLTMNELRDVDATLRFLSHRGKTEARFVALADQMEVAAAAEECSAPLDEMRKKKVHPEGSFRKWVSSPGRKWLPELAMMEFVFQAADGYQDLGPRGTAGPNARYIVEPLARALDESKATWGRVGADMEGIFKGWRASAAQLPRKLTLDVAVPEVLRAEGVTHWTFERVLAVALNMGNAGNIKAMIRGYGLSWEEMVKLTSVLTPEDWDRVQGTWDLIDSVFPLVNDTYEKMNGHPLKKVVAEPFEDPHGRELRGGYYPLVFDLKLEHPSADQLQESKEIDDLVHNYAVFQAPKAADSMTKRRLGGTLPPRLDLGVLTRHLWDSIQYATHAPTIRDIDRLTRDPEYKHRFTQVMGREMYQQIRPWLKYVLRPQRPLADTFDKFWMKQKKLATLYVLGLNLSVAFKQPFSYFGAMQEVGVVPMLKGLGKVGTAFATGRGPAMIREVNAMSQYMGTRRKSWDKEVKDAAAKLGPFKRTLKVGGRELSRQDVQDFGMALIGVMDAVAVYPIWMGTYEKALKDFARQEKAHDLAVAQADKIVRTTQPSANPMDLAHWQRTPGIKMLWAMFQTFTLKYGNRQRLYLGALRQGKITWAQYARHWMLEWLAPPLLMTSTMAMLRSGEPPDPDELALDMVGYWLCGLPIISQVVSSFKYNGSVTDSAIFTGVEEAEDLLKRTVRMFSDANVDGKDWQNLGWAVGDVLSYGFGLPVSRVAKQAMRGMEYYDQGTGRWLNLILSRPKR